MNNNRADIIPNKDVLEGNRRHVVFSEETSGLSARAELLDDLAPRSAALMWELARTGIGFPGLHAMWTGPEISLPIDGGTALPGQNLRGFPIENATSYPQAGDIALVCAPSGTWRDGPAFDLIDVGMFYAPGGRLLMPMGWIMGNVAARIIPADLETAAAACRRIRRSGACTVMLVRVE